MFSEELPCSARVSHRLASHCLVGGCLLRRAPFQFVSLFARRSSLCVALLSGREGNLIEIIGAHALLFQKTQARATDAVLAPFSLSPTPKNYYCHHFISLRHRGENWRSGKWREGSREGTFKIPALCNDLKRGFAHVLRIAFANTNPMSLVRVIALRVNLGRGNECCKFPEWRTRCPSLLRERDIMV